MILHVPCSNSVKSVWIWFLFLGCRRLLYLLQTSSFEFYFGLSKQTSHLLLLPQNILVRWVACEFSINLSILRTSYFASRRESRNNPCPCLNLQIKEIFGITAYVSKNIHQEIGSVCSSVYLSAPLSVCPFVCLYVCTTNRKLRNSQLGIFFRFYYFLLR